MAKTSFFRIALGQGDWLKFVDSSKLASTHVFILYCITDVLQIFFATEIPVTD